MDVKAMAEKVLAEVKSDPAKIQEFIKDGEAYVKKYVGDDGKLSADEIQKIAKEVMSKVGGESSDLLGKVKDLLK